MRRGHHLQGNHLNGPGIPARAEAWFMEDLSLRRFSDARPIAD